MTASSLPRRLSGDQLFDWLRLVRSDNVGPRTFRALIDRYGSARAALEALPELARRGGAQRPVRLATPEEIERELESARRLDVRFLAIGEADYPPLLREIELGAAASGVPRPHRGAAAASGGDRRLAQRLGGGADVRRPARARSRPGRLRGRLGARARHRPAGASGEPRDGRCRGPGGRSRQALSERGRPVDRAHGGVRRGRLRDADRAGAARARFPSPQPDRLRAVARHHRRRGGARLGVTHHRAVRPRTEPPGVRGAGIAARSARRRNERSPETGRDDVHRRRGRDGRAGANALARPILGPRRKPRGRAGAKGTRVVRGGSDRRAGARLRTTHSTSTTTAPTAIAGRLDAVRDRIAALLGPTPIAVDALAEAAEASARETRVALLELELAGRIEFSGGDRVAARNFGEAD